MKLLNAFSLSMVELPAFISAQETSMENARELAIKGVESFVGHAETATLYTTLLGVAVPVNRASIKLERGERVLVGQYVGPRLPEGATSLPEGATIRWILVEVQ